MQLSFLPLTLLLSIFTLVGGQNELSNQKTEQLFTIYLVRHAEKDLTAQSGGNPPLTQCGKERAQALSTLLKDVPIKTVYSTNYTRTINTAAPTAKAKGLEIEQYDGNNLEAIAKLLLSRKQDALVVGHSNTTGVLAGLLTGKEQADIDLDTYNRIYQVVVHKKCSRLHLLHTAFQCN